MQYLAKLVSPAFLVCLCLALEIQDNNNSKFVTNVMPARDYCEDNTTIFVEEIFKYLRLGDSQIEIGNNTNVVIFIGETGSGTTTVSQFIAGHDNTLTSVYNDMTGECSIMDDRGLIAIPTLYMSKTFVPNFIDDKLFQTSLYDIPGFSDNRNQSVEVAQAFFLNKILDHAQQLKIVFIAPHNYLASAERLGFFKMIKRVATLFPNIGDFAGSIALIVNFAPNYLAADQILYRYQQFLKMFEQDMDEIYWDSPEQQQSASELMKILNTNLEGTDLPKYLGFLLQPVEEGPLEIKPRFQETKSYLRGLILERLAYKETKKEDFGYSQEVQNILLYLKNTISQHINMLTILVEDLTELLLEVSNPEL